jgi:hypothetical protein
MSIVTGLRLIGRLTAPNRTQSTGGSRFNTEIIGSSKRFPTDFFAVCVGTNGANGDIQQDQEQCRTENQKPETKVADGGFRQ